MKTIPIPVEALTKIASFLEAVPTVLASVQAEPQPTKQASESVKQASLKAADDLVKYAGLDPSRKDAFANFMLTQDGSIKVIGNLITKIASVQADLAAARQSTLGGPDMRKSASSSIEGSKAAWCNGILS